MKSFDILRPLIIVCENLRTYLVIPAIIIAFVTLFGISQTTHAIGGPATELDCQFVGPDCQWPNVGMVQFIGIKDGVEYNLTAGSGSLLLIDNTKIVVLTAGHVASARELFEVLRGQTVSDVAITFAPVFDPPNDVSTAIRGAVPVYNPKFYSWLAKTNPQEFDLGLVVIPRNATNKLGQTFDDLNGIVAPVKVLGNDTIQTFDSILQSFKVNGLGQKNNFIATLVGHGVSWISQTGGKPYVDRSTWGKRNVADISLEILMPKVAEYSLKPKKDGVYGGTGDSGSPAFYNLNGEQVQVSVLVWGQTLSGSIHSGQTRLDHPDAINMINCARNAVGNTFQDQVNSIQTCVSSLVP